MSKMCFNFFTFVSKGTPDHDQIEDVLYVISAYPNGKTCEMMYLLNTYLQKGIQTDFMQARRQMIDIYMYEYNARVCA